MDTSNAIPELKRMTIHRALAELKLIDGKIVKRIAELNPVGLKQGDNSKVDGLLAEEDFKTAANSKFDSIVALINRKQKIKSAIVKSNGETKVTIGKNTMTVADAITFKTNVAMKQMLVDKLSKSKVLAVGAMNKNNEQIAENAKALGIAAVGKDNVDAKRESYESIVKTYKDSNIFTLADPLDITAKVEELENEISNYQTEVDAALSEINATTFIDIE